MTEGSWRYPVVSNPRQEHTLPMPIFLCVEQIFVFALSEAVGIRRPTVWVVWSLTLWSGLFERPEKGRVHTVDPTVAWVLGLTTFSCPKYSVITIQLLALGRRHLLLGGFSYIRKSATELSNWGYIACLKSVNKISSISNFSLWSLQTVCIVFVEPLCLKYCVG
jgi:hypothetical protein